MSTGAGEELFWAGIVANPAAGRGRGLERVHGLEKALQARGGRVEVALTQQDRSELVARAAGEPELRRLIVAIGGDGTVNALINEMPPVPICNLASGTENLFSKAFHTPRDVEQMADWIVKASPKRMDLGEFTVCDGIQEFRKRRFGLMLGFGFDAAVVGRHHSRRVARTGSARPTSRLGYVLPLAHEAWHYRFPPVRLSWVDEAGRAQEQTGSTAILFNLDCYALGLRFTPEASVFDGWLDSVCFSRSGSVQAGVYFASVCMGLHPSLKSVSMARMHEVTMEAVSDPVPVQMDGDPAGWLEPGRPWRVRCLPGACPVLSV